MEKKREIVTSGSTVDEAIAAGLETLGVERDAVEVEVLDGGSRGLLGIGARKARVRLVVKTDQVPEEEPRPFPTAVPTPESVPAVDETVEAQEPSTAPTPGIAPGAVVEAVEEQEPATAPTSIEEELQRIAPIARQTLEEMLEKMEIRARVEDYIKAPYDEEDYHKLVLNIKGRDLGILIGRRGETLEALQYLARLIVGREVERRINLTVDVEGYRVRRERSLRQLAQRMAERAVATGRRQVLEPMSAAERRLVHVALRNNAEVRTESIGQDENRKVTIILRGNE